MNDYRARLRYLDEVIALLYRPSTDGPTSHAPYALLPGRFVPRRLAPRSHWLPGRRLLPQGPDTIDGHLSEVFGERVRATAHVRPARRANRKPVLEVHGARGELLAFVKIGDTERAQALVRHESATLQTLAAAHLDVVVAPTVLHHGTWNGLEVLALSPLPARRRRISPAVLNEAIKEISALAPTPARATLPAHATAPAHARVPAQRTAPDERPSRPGIAGGPSPAKAGAGDGHAWHGDFSPWNMAAAPGGRLLVWDWERFATGVPLGFDALHHFLQRCLRRMRPRVAAEACLAQAVPTLAPFGLSAAEARHTAIRYLIALADRYDNDGHHPLGPVSEWLNPLVDHQEVLT
ncbi:hypothetical protein [Sphaerisporangium fuscum]|uniref:hypothetical protein n=1 Tax=Sphaerisporangium fuscum TaxID=2835868 RepID=UPI001BDCCE19|nr:hypothetical protein [Sphaerisporangium fuscum]